MKARAIFGTQFCYYYFLTPISLTQQHYQSNISKYTHLTTMPYILKFFSFSTLWISFLVVPPLGKKFVDSFVSQLHNQVYHSSRYQIQLRSDLHESIDIFIRDNEYPDAIIQGISAGYKSKILNLPRIYVGEMTPMIRIMENCDAQSQLRKQGKVTLSSDQIHYLVNVMRIFKKSKSKKIIENDLNSVTIEGETVNLSQCVRLFDGINGEWLAKIIIVEPSHVESANTSKGRRPKSKIKKESLEAQCLIQLRYQEHKDYNQPWVIFAPIKKQRLKFMVGEYDNYLVYIVIFSKLTIYIYPCVEKCTELGTQLFSPVITDYTDASFDMGIEYNDDANYLFSNDKQSTSLELEKLSLIAREASEQSERLSVPKFVTSIEFEGQHQAMTSRSNSLKNILESLDTAHIFKGRTLCVCRERSHQNVLPIFDAFESSKHTNKTDGMVFLIGPEGGWSEHENALFDHYNNKYPNDVMICASLGKSILRAETCAIVAIGSYALWIDSKNETFSD